MDAAVGAGLVHDDRLDQLSDGLVCQVAEALYLVRPADMDAVHCRWLDYAQHCELATDAAGAPSRHKPRVVRTVQHGRGKLEVRHLLQERPALDCHLKHCPDILSCCRRAVAQTYLRIHTIRYSAIYQSMPLAIDNACEVRS